MERHGPHLSLIETISVKGYLLWYIYRVHDRELTDLTCPETISGDRTTGLDQFTGFIPNDDYPPDLQCNGACTASWQFSISKSYLNTPLHILADCKAFLTRGWLELSIDGGKTWQPTCDHTPFDRPPTRWIDTGITIKARNTDPLPVQIRGNILSDEPTGIFREIRACQDVPVYSEELIHAHPLGWE